MKISKKRPEIIESKLLAPLTDGSGVGSYLRYDPVYDKIREARKEDDENLSQGVWQHDLKKADFVTVEILCSETLEFRSKDIQIAAWLTDAWLALDAMRGFGRGIKLCKDLCITYWGNIYPQEDDDGLEARIRIFEWMSEQFSNRLMSVPLTYHPMLQEYPTLTLADWVSALSTESVAKRSTDAQKILSEAENKGKITLGAFRKTLSTTDGRYLQRVFVSAQDARSEIEALVEFLSQKLGKQASGFGRVKACLDDILRITKTTLEQRDLPLTYDENEALEEVPVLTEQHPQYVNTAEFSESLKQDVETHLVSGIHDDVRSIHGRKDAYQALREIGEFLAKLDPHSPSPALLEMLVGWENKSLPEILEDLSSAPSNTQMLIRLLASSLPKDLRTA